MSRNTVKTIKSTAELKPLKYKQAMKTEDKEEWMKAAKKEYHRFNDRKVFEVVDASDVPPGTRPMTENRLTSTSKKLIQDYRKCRGLSTSTK